MFETIRPFESPSGATLALRELRPVGSSRGNIVISHGLAEHSGRYGAFAGALAAAGFAVFAFDHRGHGATCAPDAPLRRFARRNGARRVMQDIGAVVDEARKDAQGRPVILFGHSMGALIALCHALRRGDPLAGLALWNMPLMRRRERFAARLALGAETALKGSDVASGIMAQATVDAWARQIEARRTDFDWLSHDEAEVDAYVADPLCGWSPTISLWRDIVTMEETVARDLPNLPADLPIHLLGGGEDPVTRFGEDTETLRLGLFRAGCRRVTKTVARGARHETLKEVPAVRETALADLIAWLDGVAPERR
ncbi:alpha/beta fold hydrolase [Consotaella salsifontis]|uniref:alpha/beta fold hydrolase n=1 Tax=Consotaella salsifontis TaxID=1365950 RepID=UPI001FD926D0|nr:alpha/beta hydrolase [Consotaella salsifontis]